MMPGPQAVAGDGSPVKPIPGKVAAAQEYIRFAYGITIGPYPGEAKLTDLARQLTKKEQMAYDAALQVMLEYFTSEDLDPGQIPKSDTGNDPGQKVPVSV